MKVTRFSTRIGISGILKFCSFLLICVLAFLYFHQNDTIAKHKIRKIATIWRIPSMSNILDPDGAGSREYGDDLQLGMSGVKKVQRLSDPSCVNLHLRLDPPKTFDLRGLASYPGCGNTWLRHLIEIATGSYTGSIYNDTELFQAGFLGELEPWNSGSTIITKTHYKYSPNYPFQRVVLLLREPYEATFSFLRYLGGGHGEKQVRIKDLMGHGIYGLVVSKIRAWTDMAKSWLESGIPVHVVHYERLLENRTKELDNICKFLHNQCKYLNTECFKTNNDGGFHLRETLQVFPPKPPGVRKRVKKSINVINKLLIKNGHEPLPVSLYKNYRPG